MRTTIPSGVSTVTLTRAARACDQRMSADPPLVRTATRSGATRSDPSVELTANRRVVVDDSPWSSTAETVSDHRPSTGGAGSVGTGGGSPGTVGGGVVAGGNATSYVPG